MEMPTLTTAARQYQSSNRPFLHVDRPTAQPTAPAKRPPGNNRCRQLLTFHHCSSCNIAFRHSVKSSHKNCEVSSSMLFCLKDHAYLPLSDLSRNAPPVKSFLSEHASCTAYMLKNKLNLNNKINIACVNKLFSKIRSNPGELSQLSIHANTSHRSRLSLKKNAKKCFPPKSASIIPTSPSSIDSDAYQSDPDLFDFKPPAPRVKRVMYPHNFNVDLDASTNDFCVDDLTQITEFSERVDENNHVTTDESVTEIPAGQFDESMQITVADGSMSRMLRVPQFNESDDDDNDHDDMNAAIDVSQALGLSPPPNTTPAYNTTSISYGYAHQLHEEEQLHHKLKYYQQQHRHINLIYLGI